MQIPIIACACLVDINMAFVVKVGLFKGFGSVFLHMLHA